jgi:Salmonella virulence plasmid 65kDa B protein/Insecticide toxin TcdB middle/N-terminal region/FG-GAP-like repeat
MGYESRRRQNSGASTALGLVGFLLSLLTPVVCQSAPGPLFAPVGPGGGLMAFVPVQQGIIPGTGGDTGTGTIAGGAGGLGGGGPGGGPAISNAGFTAGAALVSRTGAAQYSVALPVPPGTAGMQPKLSLDYSNQSGNGLVGLGWSLSGLSQISRCGRTFVQDGVPGTVNYDVNDRFCLDGQRLIVISGSNGGDNAEYRTEIDTFTRVKSFGVAAGGSGPLYWKAWTKSGQVYEYGNTGDSNVLAVGKTSVAVWALNKATDSVSNTMTFTYTEDTANGSFVPAGIQYGANTTAGTAAYASVVFNYFTSRTDIEPQYVGGSLTKQTKLLTSIQTFNGGAPPVKTYNIGYQTVTSRNFYRVASLQDCNGAGACFAPTQLVWVSSGTESLGTNAVWANQTGSRGGCSFSPIGPQQVCPTPNISFLDMNGDGKSDSVQHSVYPPINTTGGAKSFVYVRLSTGTGFGAEQTWQAENQFALGSVTSSNWKGTFADMNSDGLPDFVQYSTQVGTVSNGPQLGSTVRVCLNTGSTLNPCQEWDNVASGYGASWSMQFADMNGDGYTDVAKTYMTTAATPDGTRVKVRLGTGAGLGAETTWDNVTAGFGTGWSIRLADMTGDGLPDLVKLYMSPSGSASGTYTKVGINTGSAFQTDQQWDGVGSGYGQGWTLDLADMNGDGKADLLKTYMSPAGVAIGAQSWVMLSTGTTLAPQAPWYNSATGFGSGWTYAYNDMNADGLTDLIFDYVAPSGTSGQTIAYVYLNTGSGYIGQTWDNGSCGFTYTSGSTTNYGCKIGFADLTGDGTDELVKYSAEVGATDFLVRNTQAAVEIGQVKPSNLVDTITDGQGAATQFAYGLGTDPTVHSKGTGAAFPVIDIVSPVSLVRQVTTNEGSGGPHVSTYTYAGERVHLRGRGFLGFNSMVVRDQTTGNYTTTVYHQTHPYIGLATQTTIRQQTTAKISETIATLAQLQTVAGFPAVLFPYISVTANDKYEIDGTKNTTTTSNTTYDSYGNATQLSSTIADSSPGGTGQTFTTTTTNTYTNDTTNWFLGRMTCAKAQSTWSLNATSQTRTSGFAYDAAKGLLLQEIIEPKSADAIAGCVTTATGNITQRTTYTRDVFGNVASTTVDGDALVDSGGAASPRATTTTWGEAAADGTPLTPANGRFLIRQESPLVGAVTLIEKRVYDGRFGAMIKRIDANNLETQWTLDGFGRVTLETRPDGTTTTTTRTDCVTNCPIGAVLAMKTDTTGGASSRRYMDRAGNELRIETVGFDPNSASGGVNPGAAIFIDKAYSNLGQVIAQTRPYYAGRIPVSVYYAYDVLGREVAETKKSGTGAYKTSLTAYNHFVTTTTNEKGQQRTKTVNARGDLLQAVNAVGAELHLRCWRQLNVDE